MSRLIAIELQSGLFRLPLWTGPLSNMGLVGDCVLYVLFSSVETWHHCQDSQAG